jgi:ABC-type xylose transport system permease subunit
LLNVVRQVSFVGIIACGMTLAMIAADVDLSVGSMVAFASALLGAREGESVECAGGRVSRRVLVERIEYQPERERHFDR